MTMMNSFTEMSRIETFVWVINLLISLCKLFLFKILNN